MGCSSSKSAGHTSGARILMLGLNKAGKTQILYMLKIREPVVTLPTIGCNVETVAPGNGLVLTICDVGGDARMRPLWKNYYKNTDAIIYVVDVADTERLMEARDALFDELGNRALRGIPILFLGNKTDLSGPLDSSQLQKELKLNAMIDRIWAVRTVCAINGDGMDDAMKELANLIRESRKKTSVTDEVV